jgi:hypothetical protein
MTFTLKTLKKHSKVVTTLLDGIDCDYVYTGGIVEQDGTETHGWFISRPLNENAIGIESTLEDLAIPYDRSHRGPKFMLYSQRLFRINEDNQPRAAEYRAGDNTLHLLDELENAIAGSDYTRVRNFIRQKRNDYLTDLTWASQQQYAKECDIA